MFSIWMKINDAHHKPITIWVKIYVIDVMVLDTSLCVYVPIMPMFQID